MQSVGDSRSPMRYLIAASIIKADFPRADGPFFFGAYQLGERQHGADRLGGNRGKCRCANTHTETADQNKV